MYLRLWRRLVFFNLHSCLFFLPFKFHSSTPRTCQNKDCDILDGSVIDKTNTGIIPHFNEMETEKTHFGIINFLEVCDAFPMASVDLLIDLSLCRLD